MCTELAGINYHTALLLTDGCRQACYCCCSLLKSVLCTAAGGFLLTLMLT